MTDFGPEPFVVNIEQATCHNTNFRTALWTGGNLQLTLMSIPKDGEIGVEAHSNTDQFLRVESGKGIVKMGSCRYRMNFHKYIGAGDAVLLIEHIIREARLYREYVSVLERDGEITDESMKNAECFWNRIMMEHAMFIRGLLDPTEKELVNKADSFAKEYEALLDNCKNAQSKVMKSESLEETLKFKDFKKAGVQGITGCKIRSLILPLLADHVLREANHYIRLLKC